MASHPYRRLPAPRKRWSRMRPLCLALLCLMPLTSATAAGDTPDFVDLSGAFVHFFDATAGLPEDARVAAFKQQVAPLQPAFYGIARFEGKRTQQQRDVQIQKALAQFPQIRAGYQAKAAQFADALARNSASFAAAFPDYRATTPVVLLHSLGEMDGGLRTLDGQRQLVFGADGMAIHHAPDADESAFFHHELFHAYHEPQFGSCEALWTEGLAVHVAQRLNPGASDAELLLDQPAGTAAATRAALRPALEQLRGALDSTAAEVQQALLSFGDDGSGLPPRRGYLVGGLLAGQIADGRSLQELAAMSQAEVRPLLDAAIDALLAEADAAAEAPDAR